MDLTGIDLITETVRTERLLLRPYRPDDVEPVHRACQDPGIQRWLGQLPVPYTLEAARTFVAEVAPAERAAGTGLTTAVEADGQLMGSAGAFFRPGRLGPEIGYWMAP